ncbi:hypothetical protein VF09_37265 [Nostoc linckia z9]|nr:hypothetical protein VF09_37265 [Nostoc linckia z9]
MWCRGTLIVPCAASWRAGRAWRSSASLRTSEIIRRGQPEKKDAAAEAATSRRAQVEVGEGIDQTLAQPHPPAIVSNACLGVTGSARSRPMV